MLEKAFIKFNSWRTRRKRGAIPAGNILVLLPSCLQRSACDVNLRGGVERCARCGQCDVGPIVDLCERYGVPVAMATGGRQAAARVREPEVHAVVAVACAKELAEGVRAIFPKPAIAIENERPHGPCKDTRAEAEEVREAIEFFIKK